MSRIQRFLLALREVVGLDTFHSTFGQDKWIIRSMFPDVRDGYFVDVGSGDGVLESNTKALEGLGWKGVCIDPFPTNMSSRKCTLFEEVVYGVAGKQITFKVAGFLSGIHDIMGSTKNWESVQQAKTVELTTVTLDDILARSDAPAYIHYISIDVEGAELEVLKGFSFSKYKVGAFTIEHNYEEPKRSQIRSLLASKGYQYMMSLWRDDCYVSEDLIKKLKIH
jgi:FkbM family methyltransferase